VTASDPTTAAHGNGQYAEVNGIDLYFETHGAGRPMLLLHGGLFSGEMFGPVLPTLAERHQVIAVDLQGHGRTDDIDRPLDVRLRPMTSPRSSTTSGWRGRTWWATPRWARPWSRTSTSPRRSEGSRCRR
jgi:pimeloyl-ACP methyl ester carboxylesterase